MHGQYRRAAKSVENIDQLVPDHDSGFDWLRSSNLPRIGGGYHYKPDEYDLIGPMSKVAQLNPPGWIDEVDTWLDAYERSEDRLFESIGQYFPPDLEGRINSPDARERVEDYIQSVANLADALYGFEQWAQEALDIMERHDPHYEGERGLMVAVQDFL
jgi:hypothetical protein